MGHCNARTISWRFQLRCGPDLLGEIVAMAGAKSKAKPDLGKARLSSGFGTLSAHHDLASAAVPWTEGEVGPHLFDRESAVAIEQLQLTRKVDVALEVADVAVAALICRRVDVIVEEA